MNYTIWSKPGCVYCDKAKALLNSKGLAYTELVLDVGQPNAESTPLVPMTEFKAKHPTVKSLPHILLGEQVIGGFTQLVTSLG